ncbi:TadE/TadG family type IV pilus assembly protein [Blastopirellula marina]|uniref:TadE-like domain-containing protein n=1 Tax=Blastopirellula marina TaxID=124 RepID=A0A2S8GHN3_9BACT|nr:TadE family protein [Blastopirellula marina]PQO28999.1 hypothetical protein C5Y98_22580 [Blastopirellula marina]PQO43850.1 hypothetical protein C5Y93_21935 [Blastopirellula marina]PTL42271.1 pilus assembly protein [Blastopirellula marina]
MTRLKTRRGQSLVEFALVALVTYMLLAAILTFGRLFFVAQVVQSASNTLAREISVAELAEIEDPADEDYLSSVEDVVNKGKAPNVFDPELLIFDLNDIAAGLTLREHIDQNWPTVNKILSVVMINDGTHFRYPGVKKDPAGVPSGFYIAQSEDGEFVEWIPVVEDFSGGRFRFLPNPEVGGVVAARINYPFHSVSLSAMKKSADVLDENIGNYFEAEEFLPNDKPVYLDPRTELYAGDELLGRQYAWGTQVRPYRHIISGQAVYRREVFVPPAQ